MTASLARPAPPAPRHRRGAVIGFDPLALFLLPLGLAVSFQVVGELLLSDILVVLVFLRLLARGRITLHQPGLRPLLLLLALWCAGAVASDMVNNSAPDDLLRGWSKLALFALYLVVLFTLVGGSRRRLAVAFVGLALSQILKTDVGAFVLADAPMRTAWKYGAGFGVTVLLSLLVSRALRQRRAGAFAALALAPLHLALGARSLFLLTVLAGLASGGSRVVRAPRRRVFAVLAAGVVALGGGLAGYAAYDTLTRNGTFGEAARAKHVSQAATGPSLLLAARSEHLISLRAIADAPLLGHGSWAEDRGYRLLYARLREQRGETISWESDYLASSSRIPSHSMLLGAMVDHGVLAAPFWVFVLVLALRAMSGGTFGPRPAAFFETMAVAVLIWDLFFSPFGAARRLSVALFIAACALLVADNRGGPAATPGGRR